MNIDRRYVEILADAVLRKYDKGTPRVAGLSFILIALGAMLGLSGSWWGALGAAFGVFGVVVAFVKKSKEDKVIAQNVKNFITNFDNTGQLPPFPEKDKKAG